MTDLPAMLADWSPEALLALVVLLVLTDRLIVRKRLEDEQARTTKAQEQTDRALDLVAKQGEQLEKVTNTLHEISTDADMAVVILRGLRRHLGIEEEPQ